MAAHRPTGLIVAIAFAATVHGSLLRAKPPPVEELRPITPWNVDWAEKTCVMRRGFGDQANPLILQIERFAPGDRFQLLLTGKRLRGFAPPQRLSLEYGVGGYVHTIEGYMVGETKGGFATVFISSSAIRGLTEGEPESFVPVTPEQEAAVGQISFYRIRGKKIVLKTGSLGPVFVAMRKCADQLVESWGLNPLQQSRLTRPATPKSNPGSWLKPSDYPAGALFAGAQAIVNFRVTVDETGMPVACELQRSYSGEMFDRITCQQIVRRARFDPALDADGKPVRSYYTNTVRWVMEGD